MLLCLLAGIAVYALRFNQHPLIAKHADDISPAQFHAGAIVVKLRWLGIKKRGSATLGW
jgi:hypothetical protein